MSISRRSFLAAAMGSAATLIANPAIAFDRPGLRRLGERGCALIDLNSCCALPESFHGYENALRQGGINFVKAGPEAIGPFRVMIVPGLGLVGAAVAQGLADAANRGACVLLESGGGFLGPAEFLTYQKMIHRHFGLAVESPIDLWSAKFADATSVARLGRNPDMVRDRHRPIPYVNYLWPQAAMVRDFSRVVPVPARAGEVIGRVGELPVALKMPLGKGAVIFLGSPLGPALAAGDPQAPRWLLSCLAKTESVSDNIKLARQKL